jgi:hypothetical protein
MYGIDSCSEIFAKPLSEQLMTFYESIIHGRCSKKMR